jgi:uncharacterized coiled-coil protein SlyX
MAGRSTTKTGQGDAFQMKYIEWLDKKITQTEKTLSRLEDQKDDEYYSLYDVVESVPKVYRTCKKQYEELPS